MIRLLSSLAIFICLLLPTYAAGQETGIACSTDADCASGVCTGGICQEPIFSNGVLNGDEIDVDCGGSCPSCGNPSFVKERGF